MRILVISDLYPPAAFGGYERQCAALVDRLRARHDVTVLTSTLDRDAAPPEDHIRRELPYADRGRYVEALRSPLMARRAAGVMRDVLAETRPDVVYVANCAGIPQAAVCVAAAGGHVMVYRLAELWFASTLLRGDRFLRHLWPGDRGLAFLWSRFARVCNRHPDLRIDPTRATPGAISWCSEDLRQRVGSPPSVAPVLERTIYPGSAAGSFFASLERRPSDHVTVAYVGRVTTAKGAEVAYRALAALRQDHAIDATLVVAGRCVPGMRRRLDALAQELGVKPHVELLGPLDVDALGDVYRTAHAVLVPTVAHEAFGNVCIEAALARAPIVASRLGGIPEGLRDGQDAILFEPGDAGECAAALAHAIRDPSATAHRVELARARMAQFTVERYAAESESFIEDAVAATAQKSELSHVHAARSFCTFAM